MLECVHGAGAAQTHLDLVADHRHPVGTAAVVQLCQEAVGRDHEATVGQNRLDDQAGDGSGRKVLLGEVQAFGEVGVDTRGRRPKGVGVRQEHRIGVRSRSRVDVHARDAHGDPDAAVIAVLERDDRTLSRRVPTCPQSDIVGVRSRMAQIDSPFSATRHQGQ